MITKLISLILGMKFGWVIAIVLGLIVGGSIIKNIISGSFSVAKFAGGFNIFSGGVQGKLIYYGLIIFGCFVAYSFIMRTTYSYDTDYRNNIKGNQDVIIDQRTGPTCVPTKILFGLIQIGCKSQPITKNVTNNSDCEKCAPKGGTK
jgi:hypothetical protein